jgi:Arc/MetJ-type ribon-helix-helix transcriptional regulator
MDDIPTYHESVDFEEVDVELDELEITVISRLVKEGFFESLDESVSYAVEHLIAEEKEDQDFGEISPDVDRRIEELRQIGYVTEKDIAARFFADTTYMIQELGREIHDGRTYHQMDRGHRLETLSNHLQSVDYVLSPGRDPEMVSEFLDNTQEYAEELADTADTEHRNDFAEYFLDEYFSKHNIEEELVE